MERKDQASAHPKSPFAAPDASRLICNWDEPEAPLDQAAFLKTLTANNLDMETIAP
jgi:hypothetical protein